MRMHRYSVYKIWCIFIWITVKNIYFEVTHKQDYPFFSWESFSRSRLIKSLVATKFSNCDVWMFVNAANNFVFVSYVRFNNFNKSGFYFFPYIDLSPYIFCISNHFEYMVPPPSPLCEFGSCKFKWIINQVNIW